MESQQQKDAAAVRVFPPAIPLLTILTGVFLSRLWPIDPGFEFPTPERYWVGGMIVAGAFLRPRPLVSCTLPQNRAKRNPLEADTSDCGTRAIPVYSQSHVSATGAGLRRSRSDPDELLDSDFDAGLRLAAPEARDLAGGGLS
jgi:hypothetical protein